MIQQFTYGVLREGVIAENSLQISTPLPDAIKRIFFANFHEISAEFPQTFCKNPFANDTISELLNHAVLGHGNHV